MFVPRSVKLKPPASKPSEGLDLVLSKDLKQATQPVTPVEKENGQETLTTQASAQNVKEKEVQRKRELSTLVELSLTDYALWSTPELRQPLETQPEGCK